MGHLVSSLSKKLQWFENLTTLGALKEEARLRREERKQKIRTWMDALASIMSDSQDVPPGYSVQVIDVPPFSPMLKENVAEALDELPKRDAPQKRDVPRLQTPVFLPHHLLTAAQRKDLRRSVAWFQVVLDPFSFFGHMTR